MIRKTKVPGKKFPQKFYPQKFTPLLKLYTNIDFYTLLKPSLTFTNKTKLDTKHSEIKRRRQSVHYKYLAVKALKKRTI